jgi:hypothetical protein
MDDTNVTVPETSKLEPDTVSVKPPEVGPEDGEIEVIVGREYENAADKDPDEPTTGVTWTLRLTPVPIGKLHTICVSVHVCGAQTRLEPMVTVPNVVPDVWPKLVPEIVMGTLPPVGP